MRSIESEMLHRLNAKKDEDFPPLSAPVRRWASWRWASWEKK
jgi:hypothetical protein